MAEEEECFVEVRGRRYNSSDLKSVKADHLYHKRIFSIQLSLIQTPFVDDVRLAKCSRRFQPFHLDEVSEERAGYDRCGYPLCDKLPTKLKHKKTFDIKTYRVIDASMRNRFCSMACHDRMELLKIQLPVTDSKSSLEIPPMSGTIDPNALSETPLPLSEKDVIELEKARENLKMKYLDDLFTKISIEKEGLELESSEECSTKDFLEIQDNKIPSCDDFVTKEAIDEIEAGIGKFEIRENAVRNPAVPPVVNRENTIEGYSPIRQKSATSMNVPLETTCDVPVNVDADLELQAGFSLDLEEDSDLDVQDAFDAELDADLEEDDEMFLDLSDAHEIVSKFEMSPMMKLANAIFQWKEPKLPDEQLNDDGTYVERMNILNSNLALYAKSLSLKMDLPWLNKKTALECIQFLTIKFNYSRATPSFAPVETEILALVLVFVGLSRMQKRIPDFSSDVYIEKCNEIVSVRQNKPNSLSLDEFSSFLGLANLMI